MRRLLVIVVLLLALPCFALAQTPAAKPGPEHKKLDIWLGDWTYAGEQHATPLGPAGKFSGKNTTRPILGGFFIEFRGEDKGPAGTMQWIEVDGYDPLTKKYTWNNFASDGTVQTVTYTVEGTTVLYAGTVVAGGKEYKFRGTCVFSPDFTTNTDKREISVDGKTWMALAESKATKTK